MNSAPTSGDILQPEHGTYSGDHRLLASPEHVIWGRLPASSDTPVLTVSSGETVTFDTVSHEGILEDQGRDPVAFFAAQGVPAEHVLHDAVTIAAEVKHDPAVDGPHVVVGPVAVRDAKPGDVLAMQVVSLQRRVPYGVVSNRHGRGALPEELPASGRTVSVFTGVEHHDGEAFGSMPRSGTDSVTLALHMTEDEARQARQRLSDSGDVRFPLSPFLGIMGVATATDTRAHSVPPGDHGGNIDITLLTEGATLYLPVQVDGALAYVGDPHFAQGDGEVSLTAMEASLRATIRFTLISRAAANQQFGELSGPLIETDELLIPTGMDPDLNVAVQICVRRSLALLQHRFGMDVEHAYAYLSAASDFNISQVVDQVKGVHARIRKRDFADDDAATHDVGRSR